MWLELEIVSGKDDEHTSEPWAQIPFIDLKIKRNEKRPQTSNFHMQLSSKAEV